MMMVLSNYCQFRLILSWVRFISTQKSDVI